MKTRSNILCGDVLGTAWKPLLTAEGTALAWKVTLYHSKCTKDVILSACSVLC